MSKQNNDLNNIKNKNDLRKIVDQQVAEFLADPKNKIKKIPVGESVRKDAPPTFRGDTVFAIRGNLV